MSLFRLRIALRFYKLRTSCSLLCAEYSLRRLGGDPPFVAGWKTLRSKIKPYALRA